MTGTNREEFLQPVFAARDKVALLDQVSGEIGNRLFQVPAQVRDDLDVLRDAIARSAADLESPAVRIAFVGTTKAGKSTFANGFIGRRLCPIEADEMSAGLLAIHHGRGWTFKVTRGVDVASPEADEKSIHDFLKSTMSGFVARRRENPGVVEPQPVFEVTCPLFPQLEGHTFSEVTGGQLGLSVYDLPGLRTVSDPENHKVIQDWVHRAFDIVVIDRAALFRREERAKLLEELERTLKNLGGRTSTMLFVMNKCDQHTSEDKPLDVEVREVSNDIQAALRLAEPVTVVPFTGLAYYHAARLLNAVAEGRQTDALQVRDAMLKDCSFLAFNLEDDEEEIYRTIRRQVKDHATTDPADLRVLVRIGLRAANHEGLWYELEAKLRANLSTIVIYPLVNETVQQAGRACRTLKAYGQSQLVETEDDLRAQLALIGQLRQEVSARLQSDEEVSRARIQGIVTRLREVGRQNIPNLQPEMAELGIDEASYPDLFRVDDTINRLVARLDQEVLRPLRKAFEERTPVLRFKENLEEIADHSLAAEAANGLDGLREAGYGEYISTGWKQDLRAPSREIKDKLARMQRSRAGLYFAIRKILTAEAERHLRAVGVTIAAQVDDFVVALARATWTAVCSVLPPDLRTMVDAYGFQFAQADFERVQHLTIPEDVLQIPLPDLRTEVQRTESRTTYEDPNASCFKGDVKTTFENVTYVTVTIPSAADIYDELLGGLRANRDRFWERFFAWLEQCFHEALAHLCGEVSRLISLVETALQEKMGQARETAARRKTEWEETLGRVTALDREKLALAALAGYRIQPL